MNPNLLYKPPKKLIVSLKLQIRVTMATEMAQKGLTLWQRIISKSEICSRKN